MNRGASMLKNDYSFIKTVLIVIIGILSYWCLNNLSVIFGVVSKLISVIMPFIVGFVIAYILNIPMKKFEGNNNKEKKYDNTIKNNETGNFGTDDGHIAADGLHTAGVPVYRTSGNYV